MLDALALGRSLNLGGKDECSAIAAGKVFKLLLSLKGQDALHTGKWS